MVRVQAMDGEVGGVAVIEYVIDGSDDRMAQNIQERRRRPIEARVNDDRDPGEEGTKANES